MNDPGIDERFERTFLGHMPRDVADSFNAEQMAAIKAAYGANQWRGHRVDLRGTLPTFWRRWYYVFVAGPDRRGQRRAAPGGEEGAALRFFGAVVAAFVVLQIALLLGVWLVLY